MGTAPQSRRRAIRCISLREDAAPIPGARGSFVFEPSEEPVSFCLLERPYGTVVTVHVDEFPPTEWKGEIVRSHHIELDGGAATGDTNYYSHFSNALSRWRTEDELVLFSLELAKSQLLKRHPKGQFNLFEA